MIAVDTNILVYAHRPDSPWHRAADRCLTALAEGASPWAIPWPCIHEFVGVVTHPRVFRPPTALKDALEEVECWLESPNAHVIGEAAGYWMEFRSVALGASIAGPMVHDARIVAICRQHGVRTLWSADRDLSRFAGLRIVNPLIGEAEE